MRLVLLLLPIVFFNGLCKSDVMTAPMHKGELQALYLVIQGFTGNSLNVSQLYSDPCGWTPIQGVSCDIFHKLWYVTSINIGPVFDNSLACTPQAKFNQYIFEFKHLRSLSFFNCFSSQHPTKIPSNAWKHLSESLEKLEFRSNEGLIGKIPKSFGHLTNLKSLVLVENSLTGDVPQELANLVNLKKLSLSSNALSGRIPASLGYNNSMNQLLILDFSRNSITGPIPSSLGSMISLLKLDLSNNNLNGMLPLELGNLRNLTLLDIRNNNISGGLTKSLQCMASLQDMLMSNNQLDGRIMEFRWENLRNLINLDLSNNSITGEIPESMVSLKRLRYIALDNNQIIGSVPSNFASLPCLKALYLHGNSLTGRLVFSQGFYERLGRRFTAWGNPNLCYSGGYVPPTGLKQCDN
ncbi:Leucine-rich repeat (LRR) protein associated with apoptosis in muscle tissue protein [Dioscorea alata]|uniref:Leucine-rich repeat (LRR) protein associated with apoptosis in muscle tissue protein n=2 Tax=Dioscorea alata TaxID=55571 RepID=A0ACB7TRB9_DIOAL|nr:Leucine-rich repeat (LRR) protein associated with apoptosis in muscle tissue protein [Dioscorea alata]KAH7650928.1 Leucine-rich repeat (LRR) protein associated with apoptosis in muscle tissue protein [Dioscorea alata]